MQGASPDSSVGKESVCNAGYPSSIPGSGRSPGEGIGCPLQYSGLEISVDCIVDGVAESRTRLVQSLGQEDSPEKEMATHSNIFAWEIPWTEEPGRLQFIGLQRVRRSLATEKHKLDKMENKSTEQHKLDKIENKNSEKKKKDFPLSCAC